MSLPPPLPAPTMTATTNASGITLHWDPVPGTAYDILPRRRLRPGHIPEPDEPKPAHYGPGSPQATTSTDLIIVPYRWFDAGREFSRAVSIPSPRETCSFRRLRPRPRRPQRRPQPQRYNHDDDNHDDHTDGSQPPASDHRASDDHLTTTTARQRQPPRQQQAGSHGDHHDNPTPATATTAAPPQLRPALPAWLLDPDGGRSRIPVRRRTPPSRPTQHDRTTARRRGRPPRADPYRQRLLDPRQPGTNFSVPLWRRREPQRTPALTAHETTRLQHPSGNGYWIVTTAGRVFAFGGTAQLHGNAPSPRALTSSMRYRPERTAIVAVRRPR